MCCRYNQQVKEALQELFKLCGRPLPQEKGIEPTQLFSMNRNVNSINNARLDELEGKEVPRNFKIEANAPPSDFSLYSFAL